MCHWFWLTSLFVIFVRSVIRIVKRFVVHLYNLIGCCVRSHGINLTDYNWFLKISVLCYIKKQFYWWRKPKYPRKTTDLPQVTDKLYRIIYKCAKCKRRSSVWNKSKIKIFAFLFILTMFVCIIVILCTCLMPINLYFIYKWEYVLLFYQNLLWSFNDKKTYFIYTYHCLYFIDNNSVS